MIWLGLLAFSSALFLSPLNAWMQDRYPPRKRGELQSAVNLQNCFAGIIAVVAIEVMILLARLAGVSEITGFRIQALFVGLSCGLMTWFIIRLLPADFIRLVALALVKSVYRIKFSGIENLPKKGGVLLLPNHVTFADSLYISAISERRVRFVMDETFMERKLIRFSAKLFGTVPIRRDQPLEAIRKTIEALENGDVVALFPEGQLTRTGGLCELERGFELIARKTKSPIFPVWVEGSWGSIFSFERGKFFKKLPYRVPYGISIAVGEEITKAKPVRSDVQAALMRASADAVARRFSGKSSPERINAHQITQLGALPRRSTFHILESESELTGITDVLHRFAKMTGGKFVFEKRFDPLKGGIWIGAGDLKRQIADSEKVTDGTSFHDFSERADVPLEKEGIDHLPCLSLRGLVVAMSMPHPPQPKEPGIFQAGNKPGSFGKILPGWYLENGNLFPGNIPLPEGVVLDSEGFLVSQSE